MISNHRPGRSSEPGKGSNSPSDRRRGSEVPLFSASLRLRGSADLITQSNEIVQIVDYKTGRLTDAEGEIRHTYRLQLLAYALMVLEQEPKAKITLALDNGSRMQVDFDDDDLDDARREIDRMVAALPVGADVAAANLAEPGPDCVACSIRPSCPAYLAAAPGWWHDVPAGLPFVPQDSWGEVRHPRAARCQAACWFSFVVAAWRWAQAVCSL